MKQDRVGIGGMKPPRGSQNPEGGCVAGLGCLRQMRSPVPACAEGNESPGESFVRCGGWARIGREKLRGDAEARREVVSRLLNCCRSGLRAEDRTAGARANGKAGSRNPIRRDTHADC